MTDQGTGPDNTVSVEVRVANELGLHARPAAKLAQEAQRFGCDIFLVSGDREVDAKSILDILTLAAQHGGRMQLRATGEDADEALQALTRLFKSRFGEE